MKRTGGNWYVVYETWGTKGAPEKRIGVCTSELNELGNNKYVVCPDDLLAEGDALVMAAAPSMLQFCKKVVDKMSDQKVGVLELASLADEAAALVSGATGQTNDFVARSTKKKK